MVDIVSTISWVFVRPLYPFPYPASRATSLFATQASCSSQSIHLSKLPLTPVAVVGLVISCGPPVEDSHSSGLVCPYHKLLGTVADVGCEAGLSASTHEVRRSFMHVASHSDLTRPERHPPDESSACIEVYQSQHAQPTDLGMQMMQTRQVQRRRGAVSTMGTRRRRRRRLGVDTNFADHFPPSRELPVPMHSVQRTRSPT